MRQLNVLRETIVCWNLRGRAFILLLQNSEIIGVKKSILVRSETFELFINTLTADYNYLFHRRRNFLQSFQTTWLKRGYLNV